MLTNVSHRNRTEPGRCWSASSCGLPAELDTYLEHASGLSHAEYGVLRCLTQFEDREIHMSRLAATASVTPSHLSRIVSRLEKRGYLTRHTDTSDGRRTLARLTKAGAQLVAEVEPGYANELRQRLFSLLTDQQAEQLEDLAEAILTPLRGDCVAQLPQRSMRTASRRGRSSGRYRHLSSGLASSSPGLPVRPGR